MSYGTIRGLPRASYYRVADLQVAYSVALCCLRSWPRGVLPTARLVHVRVMCYVPRDRTVSYPTLRRESVPRGVHVYPVGYTLHDWFYSTVIVFMSCICHHIINTELILTNDNMCTTNSNSTLYANTCNKHTNAEACQPLAPITEVSAQSPRFFFIGYP